MLPIKLAVKQVDLHSHEMCVLFYSNASWVYVVSWLPDTETYK